MRLFGSQYHPIRKILFFLGEGFLIFFSVLATLVFFSGWKIFVVVPFEFSIRAFAVTLSMQFSFYLFDLYDLRTPESFSSTFIRLIQACGIGCIMLGALYFVFPSVIIENNVFFHYYAVVLTLLFCWRWVYHLILEKKWFSKDIVIIGTGNIAEKIVQEISLNQESGFIIRALIGSTSPGFNHENIPLVASLNELGTLSQFAKVRQLVVALDDKRGAMPLVDLLDNKLQGRHIDDGISFYEVITGKILVEKVNPAWLIFSEGFEYGRKRHLVKRFCDLLFATVGLILTLPITIVTAVLIKIESRGPILYRQERIGERGATFTIVKFRSMRQDAEKNGAVWARQNDNRVTKIGSFIRKVRIDEIPQMWNVICGEMSFVGPRPERPIFVEQLIEKLPYYSLRHTAKPGITGWAQICYPYGASEEDALRKLEYDLYYIKYQSFLFDVLIIFRTIKTVLFKKGSR